MVWKMQDVTRVLMQKEVGVVEALRGLEEKKIEKR